MVLHRNTHDVTALAIEFLRAELAANRRFSGQDVDLPGPILWYQGLTAAHLGNFEQAEEFYKRVRKTDPAHSEMLDFYRSFHGDRSGSPAPARTTPSTADDSTKLLQVLTQA